MGVQTPMYKCSRGESVDLILVGILASSSTPAVRSVALRYPLSDFQRSKYPHEHYDFSSLGHPRGFAALGICAYRYVLESLYPAPR